MYSHLETRAKQKEVSGPHKTFQNTRTFFQNSLFFISQTSHTDTWKCLACCRLSGFVCVCVCVGSLWFTTPCVTLHYFASTILSRPCLLSLYRTATKHWTSRRETRSRLHPRNYTLLATTTITASVCFSVFNEICASDLRPPHTSEGGVFVCLSHMTGLFTCRVSQRGICGYLG